MVHCMKSFLFSEHIEILKAENCAHPEIDKYIERLHFIDCYINYYINNIFSFMQSRPIRRRSGVNASV